MRCPARAAVRDDSHHKNLSSPMGASVMRRSVLGSEALAEKLAAAKGLRAHINGFTAGPAYLEPAHGVSSPTCIFWFRGRP